MHLSHHIAAIAAVTKGFTSTATDDVAAIFGPTLSASSIAMRHVVCSGHGSWPCVRSKYVFLLQRLASVLGDKLLQPFTEVAPLLLGGGGEEDDARGLTEVVQLSNKLLVKFGGDKMRGVADALVAPLMDAVTRVRCIAGASSQHRRGCRCHGSVRADNSSKVALFVSAIDDYARNF